jgi:hypothetical protein
LNNWVTWALGIGITIIIGLIVAIYTSLLRRIDAVQMNSTRGLSLKVDSVEYKVTKEWQQEAFKDMRIVIKELRDENNESHKGILLELQRFKQ